MRHREVYRFRRKHTRIGVKGSALGDSRMRLRLDARTVWEEQELYLEQPAYGTSYITGKAQAGLIPTSLIRWELTGQLPADIKTMLEN